MTAQRDSSPFATPEAAARYLASAQEVLGAYHRDQTAIGRVTGRIRRLVDSRWKGRPADLSELYLELVNELLVPMVASYADIRLEPFGDEPGSYLHEFTWTPAPEGDAPAEEVRAWNVVARLRGTGDTGRAHVVFLHADGLSTDIKRVVRNERPDDYQGANDNAAGVAAGLEMLEGVRLLLAALGTKSALPDDVIFVITSAEEPGLIGASHEIATGHIERNGLRIDSAVAIDSPAVASHAGITVSAGYTRDEAEANRLFAALGRSAHAQHDAIVVDQNTSLGETELRFGRAEGVVPAQSGRTLNNATVGEGSSDWAYHSNNDEIDRPGFSVERVLRTAYIVLGGLIEMSLRRRRPEHAEALAWEGRSQQLFESGELAAAIAARAAQAALLDRHAQSLEARIWALGAAASPDTRQRNLDDLAETYEILTGAYRVQAALMNEVDRAPVLRAQADAMRGWARSFRELGRPMSSAVIFRACGELLRELGEPREAAEMFLASVAEMDQAIAQRTTHRHEPMRLIRLMSRQGEVLERAAIALHESGDVAGATRAEERFIAGHGRRHALIERHLRTVQGVDTREDRLVAEALGFLEPTSMPRLTQFLSDRDARHAAAAAEPIRGPRRDEPGRRRPPS